MAYSLFVWLVAGAGLFWEKSTACWLLVVGLFREKSTASRWLISQANRALASYLKHWLIYFKAFYLGSNIICKLFFGGGGGGGVKIKKVLDQKLPTN
jgi:hypothetical protein